MRARNASQSFLNVAAMRLYQTPCCSHTEPFGFRAVDRHCDDSRVRSRCANAGTRASSPVTPPFAHVCKTTDCSPEARVSARHAMSGNAVRHPTATHVAQIGLLLSAGTRFPGRFRDISSSASRRSCKCQTTCARRRRCAIRWFNGPNFSAFRQRHLTAVRTRTALAPVTERPNAKPLQRRQKGHDRYRTLPQCRLVTPARISRWPPIWQPNTTRLNIVHIAVLYILTIKNNPLIGAHHDRPCNFFMVDLIVTELNIGAFEQSHDRNPAR